jgi:hypothetical protein
MNSAQESKNELEAAIRYAENAISSAKTTIESMEFRQEMAQKSYQEQTGREKALQNQVDKLKHEVEFYTKKYNELVQLRSEEAKRATMPVIPKAVAIAIFREGVQHGVEAACTELEGQTIMVEESEYVHNFEVSFTKEIDLDNELDLDWMRGKCGDYSEESVIDALGNLCADKKFECRIHGVDDEAKDSASA